MALLTGGVAQLGPNETRDDSRTMLSSLKALPRSAVVRLPPFAMLYCMAKTT